MQAGDNLRILGAGVSTSGSYPVVAQATQGCAGRQTVVISVTGESTPGTANNISILPLSQSVLCAGGSLSVPFSTSGVFNADNVFSVQLLDHLSVVGRPRVVATLVSNTTGSPLTVNLLVGLPGGDYGVRVVSSSPFVEGSESTTTLRLSAIPSVTATNSSPAGQMSAGGSLSFSVTGQNLKSATYAWTGPNSFTSIVANPTLPATTTASNGTYTVTLTVPGGCTATAQTVVVLKADTNQTQRIIRIKSVDATPTETDLLPRVAGGLGTLALSVEELDGQSLAGYTYRWAEPTSTSAVATTATTSTLTGRRIGEYKVTLTNGVGDTLVAYITLRVKPCRQVAHTYQCGRPAAPVGSLGDVGLSSLAPGDTIRTGDFDLIVTEVLSEGNGIFTGIGYTQIPYLKSDKIAVEFKNASVNDCYEYTGGGTVQSAYDPSYFSDGASVDEGIKKANEFFTKISVVETVIMS